MTASNSSKQDKPDVVKAMGRPTVFSDEIAATICERIANGESLKHITEEDGMPSRATVHSWLLNSAHKDFLDKYEEAREMQADVYADEMDDIAKDTTIDVQRARLIIDTRKWTSSKLKPKKYGDKLDIDARVEQVTPILGGKAKEK